MGTRANIWRPRQDASLGDIYLNVATERPIHGVLWFAFAKRNNLNVLCFDLVSFVDIALRVMPATGKFKPSQWKYTLALYIFVIKFVVRGIAELTSTGVVLLLVHLCR